MFIPRQLEGLVSIDDHFSLALNGVVKGGSRVAVKTGFLSR